MISFVFVWNNPGNHFLSGMAVDYLVEICRYADPFSYFFVVFSLYVACDDVNAVVLDCPATHKLFEFLPDSPIEQGFLGGKRW